MKLSHLSRYSEILGLLWKYGRSDWVRRLDDSFEPQSADEVDPDSAPEQLADDLEAMGPTYIKLGQVLAGRPDLLPPPYVKALSRLQDNVKPFEFAEVQQAVEEGLGVRLSKAFASFEEEPMAAASLGQVHAAVLRDGREVVVKVQRPGIRERIAEDFEALEGLAEFLDAHTEMGRKVQFGAVLEEFRQTIRRELNYEREAQNLRVVGANLKRFDRIYVPQPIDDYCAREVLTMERVQGRKVTELSPLASLDMELEPLIEQLFESYLQQVLIDGLFHADPHPGNIFVTDDGRLALLDLGMVGYVSIRQQGQLLKVLMGVSEGRGEEAAEAVVQMSERVEAANPREFRREVGKLISRRHDQDLRSLDVGRSLLDLSKLARDSGLRVPSELTVLGKTLMQLESVGRTLEPEFNPAASIQRHVDDLMTKRMKSDLAKGNVFASLLEAKEFAAKLPGRLNRILDVVASSDLQVKVKSQDAKPFLEGLQKIANRITAGMVLGALIVGAALMMRVSSSFQLFGYPGLAILCFLAAAAGGFYLVLSIFVQDYRTKRDLER
ncbi:ABC1 kinase family protein [Actomonas aquatica]|uniref:AarF/UbiB family protein n=1 Tax=Actomonas aquatica TaxID=2866162 RepID=A0ABZ1C7J3_9BACT|nr:AarF/UbiB family protein [Opitutus sp. WL0086]WRQ86499.1 AarF/UbiB family protein [Opitutus sp. WL0086]